MKIATRTDQELLRLLSENDENAFEELYHHYASQLYTQAFQIAVRKLRIGLSDFLPLFFLFLYCCACC